MKNLWTKRNITKFFEIINIKLTSKKKNQQVEVEEEYSFIQMMMQDFWNIKNGKEKRFKD